MKFIKLFSVLCLLLTGCASGKTNIPAPTQIEISSAPTNISLLTKTAIPTLTSIPEPTPLNFSGKGDATLDVSAWPHTFGLISYEGQSNKGFFAIVPYDENNKSMSSICTVNTFDPYKGACLFNSDGTYATHLEIKTTGNWKIKISSLSQASILTVPGAIEGIGNDVVVLAGGVPNLVTITGNAKKQLFILVPYKADGSKMISLINTIDPYKNTVNIKSETAMIEIVATGSWSIAVASK